MSTDQDRVFIEADKTALEVAGEGVWRRLLGHDAELMMTYVTFRRGSVGALHHHPHRQVSYVVSGQFEVQIGDRRKVLKEGDGYLVPPDVLHGCVALEDGALVDVFTPRRDDFLQGKA